MTIRTVTLASALLFGVPAMAQSTPPEGALPLSEILAMIEADPDTAWIEDAAWDDDGYWEVDYYTDDGREVEVKIDPMSGDRLR